MDILFTEGVSILFKSSLVLFDLNEKLILNCSDGAEIFNLLKNISLSPDEFILVRFFNSQFIFLFFIKLIIY